MSGLECAPSVILLRGAPAVGKSTAAVALVDSLGCGAVVEVDALRAAQARCDWHDRRQHDIALDVAGACVGAFIARDVRPVVLVDTFGRDRLPRCQRAFDESNIPHACISLWANPAVLAQRARTRGDDSANREIADLLNDETARVRWPREALLDTSALDPHQVVLAIIGQSGWRPAEGPSPAGPHADVVTRAPE